MQTGRVGNESVPIQLAQCWFPGLAISSARPEISIYFFSNKIRGSNFIKQHSETVTVWNYQNADRSLKNKLTVLFIIIFSAHFRSLFSRLPLCRVPRNPDYSFSGFTDRLSVLSRRPDVDAWAAWLAHARARARESTSGAALAARQSRTTRCR